MRQAVRGPNCNCDDLKAQQNVNYINSSVPKNVTGLVWCSARNAVCTAAERQVQVQLTRD
mgnify:CR=1 FL=1